MRSTPSARSPPPPACTIDVEQGERAALHPGRTGALSRRRRRAVGYVGELLPAVAEAADLPGRVIVAELDLDLLLSLAGAKVVAASLSGYPAATQDVSLVVGADVPAAEVRAALVEGAGELLESLRLVDDYRGAGVPEGAKSLTFALRFRADDRTLTAAEATEAKLAGVAVAARALRGDAPRVAASRCERGERRTGVPPVGGTRMPSCGAASDAGRDVCWDEYDDVLILGGTGWLSGRVARAWMDAGASVTCLARGGRPAPTGAELVLADRAEPGAYDGRRGPRLGRGRRDLLDTRVRGRRGRRARRAAPGTGLTSRRCRCMRRDDELGADETARAASSRRCPGRSTTTVARSPRPRHPSAARLGDRARDRAPGPDRRPGRPHRPFRLLGRPVRARRRRRRPRARPCGLEAAGHRRRRPHRVHRAARRRAVARHGQRDRRHACRSANCSRSRAEIAGHTGELVEADDDWLTAHEVAHWAGPQFAAPVASARHARLRDPVQRRLPAAGGRLRPLRDTLERTLADERARGLDRERTAGLTRAEELDLLAEL